MAKPLKGVARGGQMGQQPHPGMSLPHLGGAAGQRWGSRFSGQVKNHIRIIEKSVLKEIKFTNLFNLI